MIIYIPIKENLNFRDKHTIDKLKDFEVIVDTDSEEIITKCIDKNWVLPYYRPKHLRGDNVSVVDLIKNFFDENPTDEWICQVHVTSPFLSVEHLKDLEHKSKTWEYDYAFSVDVVQNRFWRKEDYGLHL